MTIRPVIALHGGAGTISKASLTPEADAAARAGLRGALEAGYAMLSAGGTALDAVTAAVVALESHPSFNSGHGAAFNRGGFHELDASIMDGRTGLAGAVAGALAVAGGHGPGDRDAGNGTGDKAGSMALVARAAPLIAVPTTSGTGSEV